MKRMALALLAAGLAAIAQTAWPQSEKEFSMPKYANWPDYEVARPLLARRYCGLWGRGT